MNGRGMEGRKEGRKMGPCRGGEPVRADQYRQCIPIGRRDAGSWVCPISRAQYPEYLSCVTPYPAGFSRPRSLSRGRFLQKDIELQRTLNPDVKLPMKPPLHPLMKSFSRSRQLMERWMPRVPNTGETSSKTPFQKIARRFIVWILHATLEDRRHEPHLDSVEKKQRRTLN